MACVLLLAAMWKSTHLLLVLLPGANTGFESVFGEMDCAGGLRGAGAAHSDLNQPEMPPPWLAAAPEISKTLQCVGSY